jgi:hypothetical protein
MKSKPIHHLETIAPGRVMSIWAFATSDTMEEIMRPEYFDRYSDRGLRTHDRLMVVSNMLEQAEYAWQS